MEYVLTTKEAADLNLLSGVAKEELFKPQFFLKADDAHNINSNLNIVEKEGDIEGMVSQYFISAISLRQVAILFGNPENP